MTATLVPVYIDGAYGRTNYYTDCQYDSDLH